ncbi:hypothetical protein QUV44_02120 [Parasutterella secunda]|uniref:hypothetical protein n=1 Tax=Parasutterella secunda TaxID=626947 RepID=UPI0025A3C664|nr:hypothetical protein [Parasutterella secunda]MDM8087003.1 hypothetical protein [Parasutterella secunda]
MTYLRYFLALGVVIAAYAFGYNHASTKGELEIEQLKLSYAESIINTQNQVKSDYEQKIKDLNVALISARNDGAERLRQLESFRNASRDLETCTRERDRLSELAVRGEGLLKRADAYIEALTK